MPGVANCKLAGPSTNNGIDIASRHANLLEQRLHPVGTGPKRHPRTIGQDDDISTDQTRCHHGTVRKDHIQGQQEADIERRWLTDSHPLIVA